MNDFETWELPIGTLEYYDDSHTYIFNGCVLPSITQIMGVKFGNKYAGIDSEVLDKAAKKGSALHKSIQDYEELNLDDIANRELKNYKFLKKHYKWKVRRCEIPIVLFKNGIPIAAGRLDLDVEIDNRFGILDIKRTSAFDKEYVAYQTNLYRIGYRQTYGEEVEFVGGIHLREEKRRYYELPINENMAWALIDAYLKEKNNE